MLLNLAQIIWSGHLFYELATVNPLTLLGYLDSWVGFCLLNYYSVLPMILSCPSLSSQSQYMQETATGGVLSRNGFHMGKWVAHRSVPTLVVWIVSVSDDSPAVSADDSEATVKVCTYVRLGSEGPGPQGLHGDSEAGESETRLEGTSCRQAAGSLEPSTFGNSF